jgi:hypothetical protein
MMLRNSWIDSDSDNESSDEDPKQQAGSHSNCLSSPVAIAETHGQLPDCPPIPARDSTPLQSGPTNNGVHNEIQGQPFNPETAHVGERAAVFMQRPLAEGMSSREGETENQDKKSGSKMETSSLEYHLKKDRGDPLCLGTAVNMLTLSLRCLLLNDRGFLYPEVSRNGTSTTYVSETFVQKHFSAVLKIHLGKLEGFPSNRGLVRSLLFSEWERFLYYVPINFTPLHIISFVSCVDLTLCALGIVPESYLTFVRMLTCGYVAHISLRTVLCCRQQNELKCCAGNNPIRTYAVADHFTTLTPYLCTLQLARRNVTIQASISKAPNSVAVTQPRSINELDFSIGEVPLYLWVPRGDLNNHPAERDRERTENGSMMSSSGHTPSLSRNNDLPPQLILRVRFARRKSVATACFTLGLTAT